MKSKLSLILLTVTPITFVFFIFNSFSNKKISPPKAAMEIIKCSSTDFLLTEVDTTSQIAPLFDDLGTHEFKVSTSNKLAQKFFNQGLRLTYAFNHAEAHRSFLEAARLDKNMAMAYWGQAYALGPNINDQIPTEERRIKSFEAIQKAKSLSVNSSLKEQHLIDALTYRYSKDSVDITSLNLSYMSAMKVTLDQHPHDAEILTLYAAAVMNTVPWDYWDVEGNASQNINEAKVALESAMTINPNHPGANHYYIHMVELPKPELGVVSAERLGQTMPGAGHIVHMPGHIYMRVGRYADAVKVNQDAILADESYISQCYSQGLYPLGYYPHNIHFLWSAASMLGDSKLAIEAAKKTAEKVPVNILKSSMFHQNFASTPILAYTRFGKWNEILTTPDPGDDLTYMKLIWHYSRGIAFLRKNNLKEAKEELDLMKTRNTAFDNERITTASKVAFEVLSGEIDAFKGDLELAIEHLEKAVLFEDKLPYDEPAVWYIPTRQTLGSIMLKAKKYEAAEKIYKEDLAYYQQNGWSLMGLYTSLLGQNKINEATQIKKGFDKAWKHADIEINSSIL